MSRLTIGVIGDGISAWVTAFEIAQIHDADISIISANDFVPNCSLNSTSINCLRGVSKGVSELGDLIYRSYQDFLTFINIHNPNGVYKGVEYKLWTDVEAEKFIRRFSDNKKSNDDSFVNSHVKQDYSFVEMEAYFINHATFKDWVKSKIDIKCINDFVLNSSVSEVKGINSSYQFDKIIYCLGHKGSNILLGKGNDLDDFLNRSKPVAGSYLQVETEVEFDKSFNLAFGNDHFIYRKEDKVIQLSGTTENDCESYLGNPQDMIELYNRLQDKLSMELPRYQEFKHYRGIRHKGRKRLPYWNAINENEYVISGLYKNGFSFSFSAAKDIAGKINANTI